jgi:hypothetical protein
VTRVKSTGTVRLKLNISTKGNFYVMMWFLIWKYVETHIVTCVVSGMDAVGYSVRDNN